MSEHQALNVLALGYDVTPTPEHVLTLRMVLFRMSNLRIVTSSEDAVQRAIEQTLRQAAIPFEREYALNARDRIDFLAGDVGIEVKVQGSTAAVERQLARYAEHERIKHLFLVSTKVRHSQLPTAIGGKPVTTFSLMGSIL